MNRSASRPRRLRPSWRSQCLRRRIARQREQRRCHSTAFDACVECGGICFSNIRPRHRQILPHLPPLGRYLYNPDTAPTSTTVTSRRPSAPRWDALAASSRILPLVTTAWCPSASNHEFWPEMFTSLSILPPLGRPLYTDSPAPHNVSAISPLDPQLFTTIDQHAKDLISGTLNARYNSSEVIAWLEAMVATSTRGLAAARSAAGSRARTPEFRRAEEDILILNGLGAYYANLFRAALDYSVYPVSPAADTQSLAAYRKARDAWATMSTRAQTVYAPTSATARPLPPRPLG